MSETAGGGGGLSALAAAARANKRSVNLFNKKYVNELFEDLKAGIMPAERDQYQFRINKSLDEIIIYYRPGGIKHQLILRPLQSKDAHGNIIVFEYYRTEPGSNSFKPYVLKEDDDNPLLDIVEIINNKHHIVDTVEEDYTTHGSYFALRKSRRTTRNKSRRKRRSTRQN